MHSHPEDARSLLARSEVTVRVLGPVQVTGAIRPFTRAWTEDLVVYLAMHPRGVSNEVWPVALWPDRVVAEPTRHSTVSAARRALGTDAGGRDHLPRSSGRLRLGPSVTTDWDRFRALAATDGAEGPTGWAEALALVHGRPFEGLRAADWPVLEGFEAQVQDAVVQVAIALADHRLTAGDGHGAEVAARQGLLASPFDERLYRLLLTAADLQGNPGGVETVMDELLAVVGGGPVRRRHGAVALDHEALGWVHPQTADAYRSLSRHPGLRRTVTQPA